MHYTQVLGGSNRKRAGGVNIKQLENFCKNSTIIKPKKQHTAVCDSCFEVDHLLHLKGFDVLLKKSQITGSKIHNTSVAL